MRRSRSASATTRRRGFVDEVLGGLQLRIADLGGDLGEDRAPLALARSSAVSTFVVRISAQQRRAQPQAEAEQRSHEQCHAWCAGRPARVGRARAVQHLSSFSDGIP